MERLEGLTIHDLDVGQAAEFTKTISEADVYAFAGITGDFNPVHVDAVAAEASPFGGRIAHGMLTAGMISAVLGTRLPGPGCIYMGQTLNFKAPVKIGDTVRARVTVTEVNREKKRIKVETVCSVDGKTVLDGEARMMVNSREEMRGRPEEEVGAVPPPASQTNAAE